MPFGEHRLREVRDFAREARHQLPARADLALAGASARSRPLSLLREMPALTVARAAPRARSPKAYERGWVASREMPVDPIAGRQARGSTWTAARTANNSYRRTASSLRTLGGLVGADTMLRIMRTYCERYRFQHPKPEDFYATAAEVAEKDGKGDVRWLLTQLFESTRDMDFGIESIDVVPVPRVPSEDAGEEASEDEDEEFDSTGPRASLRGSADPHGRTGALRGRHPALLPLGAGRFASRVDLRGGRREPCREARRGRSHRSRGP